MEGDDASIKSGQSKMSMCDCNCERCQEKCICQECSTHLGTEDKNNKKTKMKRKMFKWKNKSQKGKVAAKSCEGCTPNQINNMKKTESEPLQESKKKAKFFRIKKKHEAKNNSTQTKKEKKKGIFKYSKKKSLQREQFDITKEVTKENNDNIKEADIIYVADKNKRPLMRESSESHSSYIQSLEANESKSEKNSDKLSQAKKKEDSSKKSKTFLKKFLYNVCCCF